MSENKSNISHVIERIADDIKNNEDSSNAEMKWKRLSILYTDRNEKSTSEFIKNYVSENMERDDGELLIYDSFCQEFRDGYMFVFVYKCGKTTKSRITKYILAAQANHEAKIVELNDFSSLQAELIRIVNLIDRQINNIDKFIEDYISVNRDIIF